MRRQHVHYYLALAAEQRPQYIVFPDPAWVRRLDQHYENFRAALAWSYTDTSHSESF